VTSASKSAVVRAVLLLMNLSKPWRTLTLF